ncbi:MAG TPA: hypothetical protein DDW27_20625 [Bacteroidales bacterium]|nr:hypothetical protein [Bacteroidales bacterium]
MKTKLILTIAVIAAGVTNAQMAVTVFSDDFTGSMVDSKMWHIPTWVSPTDGTYVGRTQFRCSQNASLPVVSNGEAIIILETYNPTGYSFYGTDLISNRTFLMGDGLIFTIRAKFKSLIPRGIVGGIFLYDLVGTGPNHDEIDFELVSNRPSEVQTNIYDNEPLGAGHPVFHPISGSVTDYHTYVIKWFPGEISWQVDGVTVRTSRNLVPERPMHFHLNIWAPDAGWAEAYDANLQWVTSPALNQVYSMIVDYVKVDSLMFPDSVSEIDRKESKPDFFPNPAHDLICFDTPGKLSIKIYSINGALVLSRQDITDCTISVADFEPGIYSVHYIQNGISRYTKLIKY